MNKDNPTNFEDAKYQVLQSTQLDTNQSEQLRQFINNNPPWIVRNGMVLFLVIVVLLLSSTWFINYPDNINVQSVILSTNPPKDVVIKNGGRIVKLLKREGETVRKKEIIAFVESTANHEQVIHLYDLLYHLKTLCDNNRLEDLVNYWDAHQINFSELGDLQNQHQTFVKHLLNFKNNLSQKSYSKRKSILEQELTNAKKLYVSLLEQQTLQMQDLKLQEINCMVADTLHKKAVYTDLEWRQAQSHFINKRMTLPIIQSSLIGNEDQQNLIQKNLLDLNNQTYQERNLFIEELYIYINLIEEWRQKYILQAPISGKIMYSGFVSENQYFPSNKSVCYITNETQQYVAEVYIPINSRAKIRIGQNVSLKFPAYSIFEFGMVNGIVLEVKNVPQDSIYIAKIGLPNGLVTNTKKKITFKNGLNAMAEITTANTSLLLKLINNSN